MTIAKFTVREVELATRLGLWVYWRTSEDIYGEWIACEATHPDAVPDLNTIVQIDRGGVTEAEAAADAKAARERAKAEGK